MRKAATDSDRNSLNLPARTRSRLVAIIAALVLLGAFASSGAPALAKGKPIYWGAQIGPQYTGHQPPWDMSAAHAFERRTKKGMSLLAFYAPFADCTKQGKPCEYFGFPTLPLQAIRDNGSIPFLSWSSASINQDPVNQPEFRLSKISGGKYDKFIRDFAIASREWGHPYFLRFDWEMNGFWFPWNESLNGNHPGDFVKAWRHVHDIFTEVGAVNANWVWCPNIALIPKLKHFANLYPGNQYVDWTCLDGFNWGETKNSAGWQSFQHVFSTTYSEVLKIAPGKPMIIGETASDERGGSKADWIESAFRTIPQRFPKIRGLIWFDERQQEMQWPIESSKSSERAFQKAIGRQIYRPNIYSRLLGPKIAPPTYAPPPSEPLESTTPSL
jgi:Glycosyl hydrolase family 26